SETADLLRLRDGQLRVEIGITAFESLKADVLDLVTDIRPDCVSMVILVNLNTPQLEKSHDSIT
ncbi:MAG: hypothetical protein WBA48_04375, partial [Xanthobacteraceae bacterium]